MYEMLEIVKDLLLLVNLLYFAWQDYHTGYVGVVAAVAAGVMGMIVRFLIEGNVTILLEVFISMAIGLVLIMISIISKESIGIGDGILFLVSGCYLKVSANMLLFVRTIFLTGGFAILCLVIGKLRERCRIPMVPFMLAAYVTTL